MRSSSFILAALLTISLLPACGQKGPLKLPADASAPAAKPAATTDAKAPPQAAPR